MKSRRIVLVRAHNDSERVNPLHHPIIISSIIPPAPPRNQRKSATPPVVVVVVVSSKHRQAAQCRDAGSPKYSRFSHYITCIAGLCA